MAVRPAIKAGSTLASTPLAGILQASVGIPTGRPLDGAHLPGLIEGLGSETALVCYLACSKTHEVLILLQWRVAEDVAADWVLVDEKVVVRHLELVLLEDPLQSRHRVGTLKRSKVRVNSVP